MSQKLVVKEVDKDRFARATEITLSEKAISTPNFCTLVKNDREFSSLQRLSLLAGVEYLGSYVIRLFDTSDTIIPKLRSQEQMVLPYNKSIEELFINFNRKNIVFIDPSLEYLLYEFYARKFPKVLRKIREGTQLQLLLDYLEERDNRKETTDPSEYQLWKRAFHRKFWHTLDRDHLKRNEFIGDFLDLENMCGADVYIPPVPIVDSEGMLDIAMRINRLTRAIAPRTKPCATYLLIQKGVLRNDSLVKKIIAVLEADQSQLTIIKIKNLDLWNSGQVVQKESYKKLMDTMLEIRRENPDKIYVAFENWYQCFISACYGFDIVSSTMHGFDRDSEYGTNTYGSWFDPDLMYYVPFDALKKIVKNTDNRLPCHCSACKQISSLESVERDVWYIRRREHYVITMNEYMKMIRRAIRDRNIELAREKIINSDISGLKNLIPRTESARG